MSKIARNRLFPAASAIARCSALCENRFDLEAHVHHLEGAGAARQLLQAHMRMHGTRPDEGALALVAPDPTLRLEHFECTPQRPAPDADLRGKNPLRRKPLVLRDAALVEEGSQLHEGEVGTVGEALAKGHFRCCR